MILASDVKAGMAIHLDDKLYKVLEVIRHAGSGQMHGFIELKMRDIEFGHSADRRFKLTNKLEDVDLAKRQMDFIYSDVDLCYFMDPTSFEQVGLSKAAIGGVERFMHEGMKVTVELKGAEAVAIQVPKIVEIKVAQTGPGIRGTQDSTMKAATLDNGVEILVPQFIETGDTIRVETEKVKYVDRVTVKKV